MNRILAILVLLLGALVAPLAVHAQATVSGTFYVGNAVAQASTARIFLATPSEYNVIIQCAQSHSTAAPCLQSTPPSYEANIRSNGRFAFNVPDGREYVLIGLRRSDGHITTMELDVMGSVDQTLFMDF